MFFEILIVAVLTVVNGLLAMSELAVVSARPARLKVMAADGNRGATTALKLAENPGRFLSSVQIGITLVGVLSGAFSGATLGGRLADALRNSGVPDGAADALGVAIVVIIITYLSLIIGELVPKQIALRDPERVASMVAPTMAFIATVGSPLVWLLDISGRVVLRLLGQSGATEERLSDEEVKTIIAEAETAGVLESDERAMISGVMRFADRSARGLMTPRLDVEMIDLSDPIEVQLGKLRATRHSVLPVHEGAPDQIVGVIVRKDLINSLFDGHQIDLRPLIKQAPVVMDRADALVVLRAIRGSLVHMALVFDEYGHFEGIVTSGDVLEAITGGFQEEEGEEAPFVRREDGSYLVSGWMPIDEFEDKIGVPVSRDSGYETVAGYVLSQLNRLPTAGERFDRGQWRVEVVDMDGRRIDKLLVTKLPASQTMGRAQPGTNPLRAKS